MVASGRTFRLFVSSTFSDLKAERDALQRLVFPALRDLCMSQGARFQAIDLRWGVSEEAALDQQTMNLCLAEIRRCQKVTPRPNFIVLLGQRYGWRPLPPQIEQVEFDALLACTEADDRDFLLEWYGLDGNAVPAEYCLRPRGGDFARVEVWDPVEGHLHGLLADAAHRAGLSHDALVKYEASATEQEIREGALRAEGNHAFCYYRTIEGIKPGDDARAFADEGEPAERLARLKGEIGQFVPEDRTYRYTAEWRDGELTAEHLDALCARVEADLSREILAELDAMERLGDLEIEEEAHRRFGDERARLFLGRSAELERIGDYLRAGSTGPLVVWGPSGCGKSALLARSAELARETLPDALLLSRFLGATPASTDLRSLLTGLCRQLGGEDEMPTEVKALAAALHERLSAVAASQPVVIFLDALDQLGPADNAHSLTWLPTQLPANARLVVSALDREDEGGTCLRAARGKLPTESFVEVTPLSPEEGECLLDTWLRDARRRLQPEQKTDVLAEFSCSPRPLFLRLAFEEARLWKSHQARRFGASSIPQAITRLLDRLETPASHGPIMVRKALGYLAAARNGLTEDEMLDVLSADDEVWAAVVAGARHELPERRLPVVIWSRLFFDLDPYLTERAADHTSLMAFYHRQVGEVVAARYLALEEGGLAHRLLGGYFCRQPHFTALAEGIPNHRKASELTWQQARADDWEGLGATLTDLGFLEAKISAGLGADLLKDFSSMSSGKAKVEAEHAATRCASMGQALATVLEPVTADPSSVGAQLRMVLQDHAPAARDELLADIDAQSEGRWWLKRQRREGRQEAAYVAQAGLEREYVHFVRFSPDSSSVLFADSRGQVSLWRWQEGESSSTEAPAEGLYRWAALLGERRLLINSDEELWLYESPELWSGDLGKGWWRRLFSCEEGRHLSAVSASPEAGYGLLAQLGERKESLLRISAEGEITARGSLPAVDLDMLVNCMAISPDGRVKAIAFNNGDVAFSTGLNVEAHWGGAYHCVFVDEGTRLATTGDDGVLALWDCKSGLVWRMDLPRGAADTLAYCPSRDLYAVGHRAGFVTLVEGGDSPRTRAGFHPGVQEWVLSVGFSPCGRYLAVGGRKGGVRIFEIDELLEAKKDDGADQRYVPFGPIEDVKALPTAEGSLFVDSHSHLFSSMPDVSTRDLSLRCEAYCVDATRDAIVAALPDEIRFMDLRTGAPRYAQSMDGRPVTAMAVSEDGTRLAVLERARLVLYRLGGPPDPLTEYAVVTYRELLGAEWGGEGVRHGVGPAVFCQSDSVLAVAIERLMVTREVSKGVCGSIDWAVRDNRILSLVDTSTGTVMPPLAYRGFCTALVHDAQSGLLAAGIGRGRCYIFGGPDGKEQKGYIPLQSSEPGVVLWDTRTWERVGEYRVPRGDGGVTGVALDPARDLMAVTLWSGRVRLASLSRLANLASVSVIHSARSVIFGPDALEITVADNGGATGDWPCLYVFEAHAPRERRLP